MEISLSCKNSSITDNRACIWLVVFTEMASVYEGQGRRRHSPEHASNLSPQAGNLVGVCIHRIVN